MKLVTNLNIFTFFIFLINIIKKTYSQLSYDDETQAYWPKICTTGTRQSPLNFVNNFSLYDSNEKIKITNATYGNSGLVNLTLKIFNMYKFLGKFSNNMGYINLRKDNIDYQYDLVELNFHVKSEHKINNIIGDLEIQLVHKKNKEKLFASGITVDPDSQNNYLIISTIFKTATYINTNLNTLVLGSESIDLNLNPFVPVGKPFFFYEGSFTTPECEETVNWIVMQEINFISKDQENFFNGWIAETFLAKKYNNRAVKDIGSRKVYFQYYADQVLLNSSWNLIINLYFLVFIIGLLYA